MPLLNIERYGDGERILFIHGSGWNTNLWKEQKEYLKSFAEVILIDLPGHGKSFGKACDSVDEYRKAIEKVILEHGFKKCFVAGHSLGGAIALSLALHTPELLKGLIIVGSGARLKVLPQILTGLKKDKEETIKFITSLGFSPRANIALINENIEEMLKCPQEVIYKDFSSCNNFDVMTDIKKIETPTLIICGLDDKLTPPKYAHYLHKEIRGSLLVLIEDAGHMVMLEKPKEVNRAIENFVKEVQQKNKE
ncbi:MAG: alpha/beta hydrolase [Deltaproteobacteria bacterium]|nr:alpha/beta hydrolase [Deltaproteobacteria bacterium]